MGRDYRLTCSCCDRTDDVSMYAHRRPDDRIIGWLMACPDHAEFVSGASLQVVYESDEKQSAQEAEDLKKRIAELANLRREREALALELGHAKTERNCLAGELGKLRLDFANGYKSAAMFRGALEVAQAQVSSDETLIRGMRKQIAAAVEETTTFRKRIAELETALHEEESATVRRMLELEVEVRAAIEHLDGNEEIEQPKTELHRKLVEALNAQQDAAEKAEAEVVDLKTKHDAVWAERDAALAKVARLQSMVVEKAR